MTIDVANGALAAVRGWSDMSIVPLCLRIAVSLHPVISQIEFDSIVSSSQLDSAHFWTRSDRCAHAALPARTVPDRARSVVVINYRLCGGSIYLFIGHRLAVCRARYHVMIVPDL